MIAEVGLSEACALRICAPGLLQAKWGHTFHVMNILGHKNIKNRLVYTHLAEELFKGQDEYVSKVAKTEHDACTLIDAGSEFVCDFNGDKLFRKRKC